jgi:predicted nuclease of predicted toxin-antitoxin system
VTLRIFVDENVPGLVVRQLRAAGVDVTWGCEFDVGAGDSARAAQAFAESRVILTEDTDFAAIVFRDKLPIIGLVLIELHGLGRDARSARILTALNGIGTEAIGKVHVIEHATIRSRDLP